MNNDDVKQDHNVNKVLHIAMFPWFAFGHLTAFLHLANKLASKGHTISFFLPAKTRSKLARRNRHPHLITLIPIIVPTVDGLPAGAETTADVPVSAHPLIMAAMDLARPVFDDYLARIRPDLVFFDFTHWMPRLARQHGAKSVYCVTVQPSFYAYLCPRAQDLPDGAHMRRAPPGFPNPSAFWLRAHEARQHHELGNMSFGPDGLTLFEKGLVSLQDCDAVCFTSCREMEGVYGDFFEKHYWKPVLWAGPMVSDPSGYELDEELDGWLKSFEAGSVVYCALGSECVLPKHQFQELLLGLELTGDL